MVKKVLILNDGSSYENWGIKACMDGLKNILGDSEFEISSLSHNYMHKKYSYTPKIFGYNVLNDNSRIAKRAFEEYHKLPIVSDEFYHVLEEWIEGKGGKGANHFISIINNYDIVIFNAEGSTYRNNIGAIKGLFMLWVSKVYFNKISCFVNGSVTLTSVDSTLPAIVKTVFKLIDLVCLREPVSKDNISSFYPKLKQLHVVPDSVFSLPVKLSDDVINEYSSKEYFCFSLSMLPNDFKLTKQKSQLVILIQEIKKFVPNVIFLAKDKEDLILKELAIYVDGAFVGPEFDYDDIHSILYNSKFLISGRYHHLIFSCRVGCPVIPLNTSSHKIKGLQQLFREIMPLPADPTNLIETKSEIISSVKKILKNELELRERYKIKSESLKEKSFKIKNILKKLI